MKLHRFYNTQLYEAIADAFAADAVGDVAQLLQSACPIIDHNRATDAGI